jgi:hypothetical protein
MINLQGLSPMEPRIITRLKEAIRMAHGCEALHVSTVPVTPNGESEGALDDVVQIFELIGHDKAKRCYAWYHGTAKESRVITMLEVAPINSPQIAVKMVHASQPEQ